MESCAYFISDAHLGVNPPGALPDREKMLVVILSPESTRSTEPLSHLYLY